MSRIYGVIPVGGRGLRLGIPFPKEMLPQKNFDYYNPVINHLVEKMKFAGTEQIIFVHSINPSQLKNEIVDYFDDSCYYHLVQTHDGFANTLRDGYNYLVTNGIKEDDKILFGLPDSVFNDNPFIDMLQKDGIVCGLFQCSPLAKVDRLVKHTAAFNVKAVRTPDTTNYFWGVLKFDASNIYQMIKARLFDRYQEIGEILNQCAFTTITKGWYIDLGTWDGYNSYLASTKLFSNTEFERKYDATNVDSNDIKNMFSEIGVAPVSFDSKDYYFMSNNSNIEFVRYREKCDNEASIPDITVKNAGQSQLNRFELVVPVSKQATTENILHMLSILGLTYEFTIEKYSEIYKTDNYTVVYYSFNFNNTTVKIIEIELDTADFTKFTEIEEMLSEKVRNFDSTKRIAKSKYRMAKEMNSVISS
jgi:adenylate cyclase class IV